MGEFCPPILRIYGSVVERTDYPLPREPIAPKKKESSTENKSDMRLRNVTLHHVIRMSDNPYHEEILKYDEKFREKPGKVTLDDIENYLILTSKAAKYEIMKARIILCTCTTASAPKFEESSYIRQVSFEFFY